MITIRKASVTDAPLLTNLARKIYREHYLHLWLPGGAEWYMEQYAYAPDKIEMEVASPNIEYYIITENDKAAGYLKLNLTALLPGNEEGDALEVERIYLHAQSKGKGLGKKTMLLAMQRAIALQKETIFLKAMDSATNAIAFYQSLGYVVCDSFQLPLPEFELMKKEYRGMVILKKELHYSAKKNVLII
jgi:ribosomal protein S18 acetylase RimI-like enzyme